MLKYMRVLIIIALFLGGSTPVLASDNPSYNMSIPCQFDGTATYFHGGLAAVQNEGKYGLIDKAGSIIVPFEYDQIFISNFPSGEKMPTSYFIAVKNSKWGIIDNSGKLVLPCEYDSVWDIDEGLAIVGTGKPKPPGGGIIDGLWGIVDLQTGEEVLPLKYRSITPSDDYSVFTVNLEHKTGVMDRTGKYVVPVGFYDFITKFNSGFAIVQKEGKAGIIDKTGKVVVPLEYNRIDRFWNDVALAVKDNKYGILDTSGRTVIPFIYGDGSVMPNGVICMRNGSEYTIFDSTGRAIAPAGKYDWIHGATNNLIYVESDGKIGAIDVAGQEVVPFIYIGVREIMNGMAVVTDGDKAAVINQDGKVILPIDYYGIINLRDEGILVGTTDFKLGLVDCNGNTILPCEYDSIGPVSDGYVVASNNNGFALFDRDGNIVVPAGEFDHVSYHINENMAAVKKDGLTGFIRLPEYIAPPDAWAEHEVGLAIIEGLVPENMQRNYQDNITRADFCRLVVNFIEVVTAMKIDAFMDTREMSGDISAPVGFDDTDDPVITAASRLGIVNGVGNNKFAPNGTIKRQDAAVMLWRTAAVLDFDEPEGTPEVFADSQEFPSYAVNAIAFVSTTADKKSGKKVMSGIGNNIFSPFGTYTRQQAYITMLRLYNAVRQ